MTGISILFSILYLIIVPSLSEHVSNVSEKKIRKNMNRDALPRNEGKVNNDSHKVQQVHRLLNKEEPYKRNLAHETAPFDKSEKKNANGKHRRRYRGRVGQSKDTKSEPSKKKYGENFFLGRRKLSFQKDVHLNPSYSNDSSVSSSAYDSNISDYQLSDSNGLDDSSYGNNSSSGRLVHSSDSASENSDSVDSKSLSDSADSYYSSDSADSYYSSNSADSYHSSDSADSYHSSDSADSYYSSDSADSYYSSDSADSYYSSDSADSYHSSDSADSYHSSDSADSYHSGDTVTVESSESSSRNNDAGSLTKFDEPSVKVKIDDKPTATAKLAKIKHKKIRGTKKPVHSKAWKRKRSSRNTNDFALFLKEESIRKTLEKYHVKNVKPKSVLEALDQYGVKDNINIESIVIERALSEFGIIDVKADIIQEALSNKNIEATRKSATENYLTMNNITDINVVQDKIGPGFLSLGTELKILDFMRIAELNPFSKMLLKSRIYKSPGLEDIILPTLNITEPPVTPRPTRVIDECMNSSLSDWTYNALCSLADHTQVSPTDWLENYPVCSGEYQSPININKNETSTVCSEAAVTGLKRYRAGTCTMGDLVLNTSVQGWAIGFDEESCGTLPSMMINGGVHILQKFEFHVKSEHSIDGILGDAELQMVLHDPHDLTESIRIAVILKVDESIQGYTEIDNYWGPLEYKARRRDGTRESYGRQIKPDTEFVDPFFFIPDSGGYFSYFGSITVPPCTENVRWAVMPTFLSISLLDFEQFSTALMDQNGSLVDTNGSSARPVQELNSRPVQSCLL